jgi:flagellar basal-body rod protein FlgB
MANWSFNDPHGERRLMSHGDTTIDAIRLALGMYQTRAEIANSNIANASVPGSLALRADFSQYQAMLEAAANGQGDGLAQAIGSVREPTIRPLETPLNLDEQVSEMVGAGAGFQSLTEALSRQFGLMRLAVVGRN